MAISTADDAFDHLSMGESTERSGRELGITRGAAGRVRRHVPPARRRGGPRTACSPPRSSRSRPAQRRAAHRDRGEGIRPGTTAETLARLKPAFSTDGTITAGTARRSRTVRPPVVVTSAEYAERAGLNVIAEIGRTGTWQAPTTRCTPSRPTPSSSPAQGRPGRLRSGPDRDQRGVRGGGAAVNARAWPSAGRGERDGGAIAIGHPIGASGARLAVHLCYELGRRAAGSARPALCGGGGQGEALLLRCALADRWRTTRLRRPGPVTRVPWPAPVPGGDESPAVRSVIKDLLPATGGGQDHRPEPFPRGG